MSPPSWTSHLPSHPAPLGCYWVPVRIPWVPANSHWLSLLHMVHMSLVSGEWESFLALPVNFVTRILSSKPLVYPVFSCLGDLSPPDGVGLLDTLGGIGHESPAQPLLVRLRAPIWSAGVLPRTHWGLPSSPVDSSRFHLCKGADKSSWQLQKRGGRFEGPFSHRILEERWARLGRRLGGAASWSSPLSDTVSGKGCWNQKTHSFVDEKPVYS